MTSSSYYSGMQFTAQSNQTVKSIDLYVDAKVGTSPTYRAGLQNDSYGNPSGSWLGGSSNYGTFTPTTTGWCRITLPTAVSLTAEDVYHIVVRYSSGTINTSNYIALRQTAPQNGLFPYDSSADSASNTEWSTNSGYSWTEQGDQPVYILETATPTYEGNPYETSTSQSIYGANYIGEKLTISGGDQMVSTLGFNVRQNNSTDPLDDLYYQIRDSANTVIRSGTLVTKTAITTSYNWYDAVLASPLTMINSANYTVNLYSTNTNSTNYYQILRDENTNSTFNACNYNGTGSVYRASTNSGSSWTDSSQYDIPFRLTPDASITESGISTVGYAGIQLSYDRWRSGSGTNPTLLVQWKPSANATWNTLENTTPSSSQPGTQTWNLPSANNTTIDIRFTNLTVSTYQILIDNVKLISTPLVPITPVGMPDTDSNSNGHHFFYNPDGHGDWWGQPSYPYWLRWELDWTFAAGSYGESQGHYPDQDDHIWDNGNICGTYPWADYAQNGDGQGNPGLWLDPGETFQIIFQATVNLQYSGSYFDEVFVRIPNQGNNQDWLYSWPTGAVSVPEYDLQAINTKFRPARQRHADSDRPLVSLLAMVGAQVKCNPSLHRFLVEAGRRTCSLML